MFILPLATGAGVVLGYALEGRLRGLGQLRLRGFGWLAVALAIQLALPFAPPRGRVRLLLLSYALAGAWFLLNARQRRTGVRCGLLVIAAGWLLNLVPIALNGAMPVSMDAVEQISARRGGHPVVEIRKHAIADRETRLAWLGDVVPVVPFRSVVSVGDLLMGAGLATTVAAAMRGARETVGGI